MKSRQCEYHSTQSTRKAGTKGNLVTSEWNDMAIYLAVIGYCEPKINIMMKFAALTERLIGVSVKGLFEVY